MQSVDFTYSETYPAAPASVPLARLRVSELAVAAGADPERLDSVRLATSEAVTNAVRHAYRGEPGDVYVTAAVVSGEIWVLIADDGCGLEARADRPGLGLGLGLIALVSDDLAIVKRAGGGVEVRMSFALTGHGRGSARSASCPASSCFSTTT
jgi:anti-sigma regulatory factor (Ser/Thr protein kinase)